MEHVTKAVKQSYEKLFNLIANMEGFIDRELITDLIIEISLCKINVNTNPIDMRKSIDGIKYSILNVMAYNKEVFLGASPTHIDDIIMRSKEFGLFLTTYKISAAAQRKIIKRGKGYTLVVQLNKHSGVSLLPRFVDHPYNKSIQVTTPETAMAILKLYPTLWQRHS